MILNLKIDDLDRAWLLWCSSFRTDSRDNLHSKVNTAEMNALGYHQEPMKIELKPNVIKVLILFDLASF